MVTLKLQSNGPMYSSTVIGTLAVDGVVYYIWYSEEGPGWTAAKPGAILAVPNVTFLPSMTSVPIISVPTHIIWCGTIIAFAL